MEAETVEQGSSWRIAVVCGAIATLIAGLLVVGPAGAEEGPQVELGDVTIVEGDSGGPNMAKLPLTLSEPAPADVRVEWTLAGASAIAGTDFTARPNAARTTIKAGRTSALVSVSVLPDEAPEGDETFEVTLIQVLEGSAELGTKTAGTGTIADDDASAPALEIGVGDAGVVETHAGTPKLSVPFTLSQPLPTSTVAITWSLTAGTAVAAEDYRPLTKPTVTKIQPGRTKAFASIVTIGDDLVEDDEAFAVHIDSIAVAGSPTTVTVTRADGTITLLNDDVAVATTTVTSPSTTASSSTTTSSTTTTTTGPPPPGFDGPVMGSPWNHLGTNDLNPGTANDEKFWLSVSGYCARKEHGDRITPRADNNGNGTNGGSSCVPAGDNPFGDQVQPNRDYRADIGYVYGIDFPVDATQSWDLEIFDAAHCESGGTGAGDSGTVAYTGPGNVNGRSGERRYRIIVRANDSLDPLSATILSDTTLSPSDCSSYANRWVNFRTFDSDVSAGTYFLQVIPVVPTVKSGPGAQEGQNQFGVRMNPGGGVFPATDICSSDGTVVASPDPGCPSVFGLTHIGLYANLAVPNGSVQPLFYLASVDARHNGREMQIELFDAAEGALGIEIIDPSGDPVTFNWEVACQDSTYRSDNGGACATSEQPAGPPGGWGPTTGDILDTSGTAPGANRPWRPCGGSVTTGCNTQDGRYSDRTMRLRLQLPNDIAATHNGNTWWRIRYTVPMSGGLGDRTTWSVRILD